MTKIILQFSIDKIDNIYYNIGTKLRKVVINMTELENIKEQFKGALIPYAYDKTAKVLIAKVGNHKSYFYFNKADKIIDMK